MNSKRSDNLAAEHLAFLSGGGEMGERMRAFDWASTPLGAPGRWPQSLRSAVSMMLPSKAQIICFWGPDFTTLYNDGYRPVFGGKHPRGTHNALVALGDGTYLEIIAVQLGAKAPEEYAGLRQIHALTPIGWAVSSGDSAQLRSRLESAGLAVTEPSAGSRTTPAGATLSWQTFGLKDNFEEAPFFIVWSAQTPHPSTTSPQGCTLQQWRVAGAHQKALEHLRDVLDLRVDVANAAATKLQLSLSCPKGRVEFE